MIDFDDINTEQALERLFSDYMLKYGLIFTSKRWYKIRNRKCCLPLALEPHSRIESTIIFFNDDDTYCIETYAFSFSDPEGKGDILVSNIYYEYPHYSRENEKLCGSLRKRSGESFEETIERARIEHAEERAEYVKKIILAAPLVIATPCTEEELDEIRKLAKEIKSRVWPPVGPPQK